MTAEDFVYTYGDYYIDSELTPDTGSSFWSLIASFLGLAAFVLLASAALYTAQLNITLKQLKRESCWNGRRANSTIWRATDALTRW